MHLSNRRHSGSNLRRGGMRIARGLAPKHATGVTTASKNLTRSESDEGHACHTTSTCSPRKHVRPHEDETQHPRCGHHPWTVDSPTIGEKICHEQCRCNRLLETTLAELESSSTWFSTRSIQGRPVATTQLMVSTSLKFAEARVRTIDCHRRNASQ